MVVLPASSVTVQVISVGPVGKVGWALFTITGVPQLSDALGGGGVSVAKFSPGSVYVVISAGVSTVGFSVSIIVISSVQEREEPTGSTTVKMI